MTIHTILPVRQLLPSPRTFRRSSLISARRKYCQRGVPVSANLDKEAMNSLELDREVIRCKTCGLVQYRTRTGNCRRCVRALPQRLEFLIPPPAPPEEIAEALNVGLNRFFIPESDGEALLEDPFIQGLRPFLRQLDWEQWQSILKRLQAISDHVHVTPVNLRPIGNPARLPQPASANGNANGHIGTGHS